MAKNVLKWFGRVKRIDEEKLIKMVYRGNVEGNRERGRPQRSWRESERVLDGKRVE